MAVEVANVKKIRRKYVATVVCNLLVFIIAAFLHTFASFSFGVSSGLFPNTLNEVSAEYIVRITHTFWCETTLWVISYSAEGIWLTYSVILIWRKSHKKESDYKNPVICTSVYIYNLLTLIFTIFWLMAYCYEIMWVSFIFGVLMQIHLGIGLGCSLKAVRDCRARNATYDSRRQVFTALLLVHNPLGLIVTAICYIVVESFAQTIVYNLGGSMNVASAVGYIILVAEMATFYIADLVYVWQHTIYLITPYIVLIWLFIGGIAAQKQFDSWEWKFSVFLLLVSILLFIIKLALTIYRVWYLGYKYDDSCVYKPKKKNLKVVSGVPRKGILKTGGQEKQTIHQIQPAILREAGISGLDTYQNGAATIYHIPPKREEATYNIHSTIPPKIPAELPALPPAAVVQTTVVPAVEEPSVAPLGVGSVYHIPPGALSSQYMEIPGAVPAVDPSLPPTPYASSQGMPDDSRTYMSQVHLG